MVGTASVRCDAGGWTPANDEIGHRRSAIRRPLRPIGDVPCPTTWGCLLRVQLHCMDNGQSPGVFTPRLRLTLKRTDGAQGAGYFSSTVAPTSSRSFLNLAASSFETPS